ncbi:MAG TPA: TPM domain-containing protein [Candidatus Nanoarchaeia archaeon]|nr:TPM domain-containing protein [Candidatus Nanoarchaeia archaeon]
MKKWLILLLLLLLIQMAVGQTYPNIHDEANVLQPPYRALIEQGAWTLQNAHQIPIYIYTITSRSDLPDYAKQLRGQIPQPSHAIQLIINPASKISYGYVGNELEGELPRSVLDQMLRVILQPHLEDQTYAAGVNELLLQMKGYLAKKPEILNQYQPSAKEEAHTLYWTGLFILLLIIGNTLLTLIHTPKNRWTAKSVFSIILIVASVFINPFLSGGLLLLSAALLVLDAHKAQQPQTIQSFSGGSGGFGTTGFGGYATHTPGFGNTSFQTYPTQRHLTVRQKAHQLISASFGQ